MLLTLQLRSYKRPTGSGTFRTWAPKCLVRSLYSAVVFHADFGVLGRVVGGGGDSDLALLQRRSQLRVTSPRAVGSLIGLLVAGGRSWTGSLPCRRPLRLPCLHCSRHRGSSAHSSATSTFFLSFYLFASVLCLAAAACDS